MICSICGGETVTIDNVCVMCGTYLTQLALPCKIKTSISGLEKIEPLVTQHISYPYWSVAEENRAKLNKVIEKVNLLIDLQNKGGEMTTKEEPAQSDRTRKGLKMCADWLLLCLSYGWGEEQLDELEKLWWKHHDGKGNLK